MKRRRFKQNAPFHLKPHKAPKRANFQNNPQFVLYSIRSLNAILILRINAIASLPISVSTPIVGRVFHFSPWSLIYAI
jgi:hypothetical protein